MTSVALSFELVFKTSNPGLVCEHALLESCAQFINKPRILRVDAVGSGANLLVCFTADWLLQM